MQNKTSTFLRRKVFKKNLMITFIKYLKFLKRILIKIKLMKKNK